MPSLRTPPRLDIGRTSRRLGWRVALHTILLATLAAGYVTPSRAAADTPEAPPGDPAGVVVDALPPEDADRTIVAPLPAPLPGPLPERRVALVIGNADFLHAPGLRNPVHDAEDVAARLRLLGFEVVERHDLTARAIGSTLREFRTRVEHASIALVFIAGHGLQVNGENYFPAVDADINGEDDVPTQSLAMNQLLDLLTEAKTRLNLLFLDACRNNPFALGTRSGTRGLASVNAPSGTVISYATRPGSVANDGKDRNGLYTGELLREMSEVPDLPIELVFKRIVAGVKQASNGRQEPWWEGSMEGNFCFGKCRDEQSAMELSAMEHPAPTPAPAPVAAPTPVVAPAPAAAPAAMSPPHPAASPRPKPVVQKAEVPKVEPQKPEPPKPVTTSVPVALKELDPLWFNRTLTRAETGRVYRIEGGQAWEAHARTLAGNGGISSIAESPNGELYFCDATEGRILRFDGGKELVVYQHTGPIKHLAYGPAGRLFFSSAMGLRNGGTIFQLTDAKALPYYTVKPDDLPQGWSGTFAFDRSGMLWLSSGSTHPASLYRVRGQQLEQVYTTSSGGVLGFSFLQDGSIVYADGAHSVYRVTLPAFRAEKIFDSPFEGPLTDVKPARAVVQAKTS